MQTFVNIFLGFFVFESVGAAPITATTVYNSEFYDIPLGELSHAFVYDENEQFNQLETEIGTALPSVIQESYSSVPLTEEPEEEASTPRLVDGSSAHGSGVLGPQTQDGFPTCLLCTCLGTTVYCDDHELNAVPPLPKKTTYFYARYNRIKKINRNDFAPLSNLKRIDLTANFISEIHEDAFRRLPQLEELVLRDNRIRQLPELPSTLRFIDVSKNRLGRKGIRNEAFK
ncbi:EPYC protein, partial [Rhinopomastus cyanomelas]|nr:EPYC protein [Rhinopomastus cyanomelas]